MENLSPYLAFSHNTPAASSTCKVRKRVNGPATFLNSQFGGFKTRITMKSIRIFSIVIVSLLLVVNYAIAQTTIRYQNNIHGGATLFGNSWFYTNSAANCYPAIQTADVDGDLYTYMSSSSDLILPAGSTIVKAYLAIERGHLYPKSIPLTSVKLKVPGSGGYQTLTPASPFFLINRTVVFEDAGYKYFYEQSVFDITSLMPANGFTSTSGGGAAGRYFLADPTTSEADLYFAVGGWSIIIVYSNPVSKYRSITVADNWQIFTTGETVNTDVAGVRVPASSTVNAVVGVTGSYGDRVDCNSGQIYTDYLRFGQTTGSLTDLKDPMTGSTNNALNSSIAMTANNNVSADGGPAMSGNITTRSPLSNGHIYGPSESWDFDADIFNASGVLPASATPINVRLQQSSNNGDVLVSGSYFISVDLAAPFLTKSLSPTTINDGGMAIYTFTVNNSNAASIAQSGISFTDILPSGIRVAAVPNATILGGTGGVVTAVAGSQQINLSNLSLSAGTNATISVNVTNMPGQVNTSCGSNPAGFTNSQSNFSSVTKVNINTVIPQCLIVNPYTVSGNVFNDPDAGNVNNSSGTANRVPAGMYATLVTNANLVRESVPVSASGVYTFSNAVIGNYTVVLSTTQGVVGNTPPAPALPDGWVNTGEYNGTPNTGNTAPIDGISAVFAVSGNVSNINFGINNLFGSCVFDNTNGGNTAAIGVGKSAIRGEIALGLSAAPVVAFGQNASVSASATNEFTFGGVTITNNTGAPVSSVLVNMTKLGFWTQNIANTTYQSYTWDAASQTWKGTVGTNQQATFKLLGASINGVDIPAANIKLRSVSNASTVTGYHLISASPTISGSTFTDPGTGGTSRTIDGQTVNLPANLLVADFGPLAAGASLSDMKFRIGLILPGGADAWVPYAPDGGPAGDIDYYVYGFADVWGTTYDYGDAPASYGNASAGPGMCSPGVYIGGNRQDYESSTTGSAAANADDDNTAGYDDENNALPSYTTGQTTYSISIPYVNNAPNATISGWIDWNNNGFFNASELATTIVATGSGNATLTWRTAGAAAGEGTIPATVVTGDKLVRTRIGTVNSEIISPTGTSADGEVEDRTLPVVQTGNPSSNCSDYFYQVGWYYNDKPQTRNPYFTGIVSAATASINGGGITGTVLSATPSESLQIPTSVINGTTLAAAITANDYIGMSFTTAASLQPGNSIVGTKLWVEQDDYYTVNPVPDASQMMPYQFSLQISTSPTFSSGVFTIVQDQTVTYQGARGFVNFVGNAYTLAPSTTYYLRYYLYNTQATASRIIFDDQDPIFRLCKPTITGTVYNDANGLNGTPTNTVDGTPYTGGGLYATLVGADNKVIANVPVSTTNGTYEFNNNVPPNQTLRVLLNTTQPAVGTTVAANTAGTLPSGYVSTGENLGAGAGNDGSPNSSLTIAVGTSPIYNANFGINCDVRAGNDGSVGICSNYQGVFSLEYVINGQQAGGVWTRLTGTGGTFNAAAGTFALTTNTTTSTFQYQVTNACGSDVSIATVVVNQIPVTTRSITICQGDQVCVFNPATTSRVIEPQTQICHNTAGTYYDTLRYAAGCDSVVITHLTVIPQPNAGDDGSISVCDNSTASIALADLITGEQAGGVWTRLSGTGGTFNATAGTFVPAAGVVTSTFQYLVTGGAPCGTDASIATVTFTTCTITISGSVHHDANGTISGVDGPLISTPTATGGGTPEQLYAVLLTAAPGQPGSTVAQYAAVSGGSYSFSNVVVNTDYYVMLTTTAPTTTGTPAPAQTLPAGWAHVSSTDASPTNGYTAIPGSGTDVSGVNFGIEQRPVANNVTWNVSGATENIAYKVGLESLDGDGNGEKKLNATDPEQGNIISGTKFQIVSVPKNAAGQTDPDFELRYNGNLVVDGTIIGNFNPALLTITFKTASPPPVTSFLYKVADNAEVFSTAPATYTINLLSILPVTGLQLKASAVSAGKNNIEWQTLTDANTLYFEVERSTDGTLFEKIGTTQAAQNSNTLKIYSFTDDKATSGVAYYRVRFVDQDGRTKLSNVAMVSTHTQQTIKLLPNPAKSFLVVTGLKDGQQVMVSGIAGGQMQQVSGSGPTRRIELAGYAAGTYILQVYEKNKKIYTGRFIKQ